MPKVLRNIVSSAEEAIRSLRKAEIRAVVENVLNTPRAAIKMGLLAATLGVADANAETWTCGKDLDLMVGTTTNDTNVYAASGIPGGVGTRSIIGTDTLLQAQFTNDGLTWADTRTIMQALDSSLTGYHFSISGYAPAHDKAFVYSTNSKAYVIDNFSRGPSSWTLTATSINSSAYGSIDNTSGDTYLTYDAGSGNSGGIYNDSGTSILDTSVNEQSGIIDEAKNRLGFYDYDASTFVLHDLTGSTSDQELATGGIPMQYLDASTSPNSMDTWIYLDTASLSILYCEDTDSGACDDTDNDEVCDDVDDCPTQDSTGYDTDGDGCIDDIDGDGSLADEDCDDNDASSYPGADEYCDGIDNDCDDIIDNNPIDGNTWHEDLDGDGAGNPDTEMSACSQPEGYVANGDDCDDLDEERTDNCDSVIDLGDGLMVEVSQGDAEDTVSFNEETGVLTLLVAGIQYDIYVGTTAISAEWGTSGTPVNFSIEDRAEIMLGIISNGLAADPLPPNEADDLAQCKNGTQYGAVDTNDQSKWMTVRLIEAGTTKSTIDIGGDIDKTIHNLREGETVSFADTVECSDEEIPEDPDTDGDGIIDSEDDCPNEFGTKPDGCPEEDQDDTGVDDDTGNSKIDDPDGGCSSVPTSPGPNALLLAGVLAGLLERRRKKNSQGEESQ